MIFAMRKIVGIVSAFSGHLFKYRVLKEHEARTDSPDDDASGKGFNQLAHYITARM